MDAGILIFSLILTKCKKKNVPIENDLPNCKHSFFAKPDMQIFYKDKFLVK